MKKSELLAELSTRTGLTQIDCSKVIDNLGEIIVNECVENAGEVGIPSLGKFKQKINKAREGINPLTQQPMSVNESHTVSFKASSSVKKVIETKSKAKTKKTK